MPLRRGVRSGQKRDTALPVNPSGSPDAVAIAPMWADQFQHLTTLGVAGAGGVLILLQAQLLDMAQRWWLALALFVLTAAFSMYGQIAVVEAASVSEMPGKKPRRLRGLALATLGAAAGAAVGTIQF